jgi:hypothetical protein
MLDARPAQDFKELVRVNELPSGSGAGPISP